MDQLHEAGEFCLVRFDAPGRVVWHSRLVVAENPYNADEFFLWTPDGDEELARLVVGSDHVAEIRWLSAWKQVLFPASRLL